MAAVEEAIQVNAAMGLTYEIESDGKTVWVNAPNCIGRFCKVSAEVFAIPKDKHEHPEGYIEFCATEHKWAWWVRRMLTAHGVVIEDKYKPEWLKAEELPDEGNLALLDQEVGRVTLRNFLDILGRESKERIELAGVLRDLNKAIDGVECSNEADDSRAEKRMAALKNLRDTFNRIPPKWFHA